MNTIFIIGAGFSRYAGFPLGFELFEKILNKAKAKYPDNNVFNNDIERYKRYCQRNDANKVISSNKDINFEEFMSFLDVEHFLRLEGSDTWSREGNLSQLFIRNLIGHVLHDVLDKLDVSLLAPYRLFVSNLKPNDVIITFNYDTLLEYVLEEMNVPYRLFPNRYSEIHPSHGVVEDADEVILLKLHGSIDWFDITYFEDREKYYQQLNVKPKAKHTVFNDLDYLGARKIVDSLYFEDSALQKIYRIRDIGKYYEAAIYWQESPLIISPSFSKLVYLNPLKDLWEGLNHSGGLNMRIAIIGFSLPKHDEYIRQPLYSIISNFQNVSTEGLWDKANLKIVDYRQTKEAIDQYKANYQFIDWSKCDCYFNGFDENAVKMVFDL